jgi:hypothetical protein
MMPDRKSSLSESGSPPVKGCLPTIVFDDGFAALDVRIAASD